MARCYAFPIVIVCWVLGVLGHVDHVVARITGSADLYNVAFAVAAAVASGLYIHDMRLRLRSEHPGDALAPTRARAARKGRR